jgi:hypothetical protein
MRQMVVIIMLLLVSFGPTHGQDTAPVEVFVQQNGDRLEVFFANPATGLSTLVTVPNFPNELNPFEELSLTANGVIFRDPADGIPRLIAPTGQILSFDYIPQSSDPFVLIDWVLSEDRRTIAWAEVRLTSLGWQADIYSARLDGQNLLRLPDRPVDPIQVSRRVEMVGVSNDGRLVYFDSEHPTELEEGQVFVGYQKVVAYSDRFGSYLNLPGEPTCICPALIANDGLSLLRLEPTAPAFDLHIWNLNDNTERVIVGEDVPYPKAGNLMMNRERTLGLYMASDSFEYVIVLVDLSSRTERILTEPSPNPLRPVRFIDRSTAIVMVDMVAQNTYKLRLETDEISQVADKIWLGTIQE